VSAAGLAAGRGDAPGELSLTTRRTRRILVLAPHPDDEIVACAVAAHRERAAGADIFVLFLTTGVPPRDRLWRWQRRSYEARIARRRDEALAATSLLGFQPVGFLPIPSRRLVSYLADAAAAVDRALGETAADCLWVTAFEGAHQDHDAANAVAAAMRDRVPVWEFAAYNFAGGRIRVNRFADVRGGVIELRLSAAEAALKRRALAVYASERGNLAHIRFADEAYRPLPRHDYAAPPHPGRLFRERFQWVPFRHPRVDFAPSGEIYAALGDWSRGGAPGAAAASPPPDEFSSSRRHPSSS
jgi:LmbE family N-acetylglucosaminyl deacetylase